jgi:Tfp pilus assembly protein PilN
MAVNLAPETFFAQAARRRRNIILAIAILIAALLGIAWLTLFWLVRNSTNELTRAEQELAAVEREVERNRPLVDRVSLFEQRLKSFDELLAQHVTWNPMFGDIEKLVPAPVTLEGLNAELKQGTMTLRGSAATVDDIAQMVASLKSRPEKTTMFNNIVVENIVQEDDAETGVRQYMFSLTMAFDATKL